MTLNEEIRKFKSGDQYAFNNILKIMNKDINSILYKYNIPGQSKDDMKSIAMQEILDCLTPRELKRGKGIKKILNEEDTEIKNRNFIKAAINYRFIRELRSLKANVRISYDIPFLQEDGSNYLDRKGKPIYVGVIYHNDLPYLIEDKKNTKVILNISKDSINKNDATFEMKNPLDASISFDLTIDDNDNEHEIKDVLEFNLSNNEYIKNQIILDNKIMLDILSKKPIKNVYKRTINNLIKKSKGDIKELRSFVEKNPQRVNKVKAILASVLL